MSVGSSENTIEHISSSEGSSGNGAELNDTLNTMTSQNISLLSTNRNRKGSLSEEFFQLESPQKTVYPKISPRKRLSLSGNRSNSEYPYSSPRKSSLIQEIIEDSKRNNSRNSSGSFHQNPMRVVRFDSDVIDSDGNVKAVINKGKQNLGRHLRLQMAGTQRIYEIKSQIEKLTADIEQLETRTKYQQFVNDSQEAKLRKNIANFQEDFLSMMTKTNNDIQELITKNKRLTKARRQTEARIKKIDERIKKYNSIIEKREDKEKQFGKKEALYEKPVSDLPNHLAINNVIQNRENRLAKFTMDIDHVKNQITTVNENLKFYKKQKDIASDTKIKVDAQVNEIKKRRQELKEENQHEIEEINQKIQDALNIHNELDTQMNHLHEYQMKISASISKSTKEYMKMDLKQQTIEHAIIIASSNPEEVNFDMSDKSTDAFILKYKKKVKAFDEEIAQRGKTATKMILKIREQKKDVQRKIIRAEKEKKKLQDTIKNREERVQKLDQEMRKMDLCDLDDDDEQNLGDQKKSMEDDDSNAQNRIMCDLYLNPQCGLRSAGQVAAMECIKNEEAMKGEIKNLRRKTALVEAKINQQTTQNGLLFAKIRAYQIKLQKIAENENKRLERIKPKFGRKDLTELREHVHKLNEKKKEIKEQIEQKRKMITAKQKNVQQIEQMLNKRIGTPPKNDILSMIKDIDELTTRAELEIIKWQTLRPSEEEYLLNRWDVILPCYE